MSPSDRKENTVKKPSIKKNFIYRTLYEVLLLVTPFITAPYVSRVLGADGVGIYSYTSSLMTFFTMFAALGTVSYGTREIAMNRDDKYKSSKIFWEIELLTIFTSLVCLAMWIVLSVFYLDYRVYLFALTPMLFGTMFDISWYFTGFEKISYTVIKNTMVRILGIICLFLFVKTKSDLMLYILLNSLVNLFGSLSMWTYLRKMLVRVNIRELRFGHHFKETMIYFVPTIATSIYTVLDKTLIGIITADDFQNGYYEQATKIVKIVKSVVFTSVNAVMEARISYLFAKKRIGEIKERINRSMSFILLLGMGAMFGLIGITENFVPIFFGEGYEPTIPLIYMMSPLIVIIGVSNCLGTQYYTPSGQRARSAKVIILGSVINLALNLCFIPTFGAGGAIVASIVAECTISVIYVKMSNGFMSFTTLWKMSWKRLIAGVIMCAAVYAVGINRLFGGFVNLAVQAVAGVAVYVLVLMIFRDKMLFELFKMIKSSVDNKVLSKFRKSG